MQYLVCLHEIVAVDIHHAVTASAKFRMFT